MIDPAGCIKLQTTDCLVGIVGNVFVIVWSGTPTGSAFTQIHSVAQRFLKETKGNTMLLMVVEQSSSRPEGSAFQGLKELTTDVAAKVTAAAAVAEGGGFRLSMMRSTAAGVRLVSSTPLPYTYHDSVQSALTEHQALLSQTGGVSGTLRTIEAMRKAASTHPR